VSAYTVLSETVIVDILDVWILGLVAGNRNRPRMHLLPFRIVSKGKAPHAVKQYGAQMRRTKSEGSKENQV